MNTSRDLAVPPVELKVRVNRQRCQGHARCAALAPELFEADEFGEAHEIGDARVSADLHAKAYLAKANCPESAIDIEERRRIQQPRHLLRAEHDRQFAGRVDERRVLDDVGAPERDPEEEPQRGHGVIENRNMRAVRRQMQLKASDVLEARRIRRSAEECSKVPDGADVALLGLWR